MTDLELALAAASAAAEIIHDWSGGIDLSYKGSVDPVTAVDRAAEARIMDLLRSHRPDDGILAEEHGGDRSARGRIWIVDPLDGTVNYVHGVPHVAVSIALYEGSDPLVGVIRDVFRGETFWATAGAGAWLDSAPIRVTTTPLDRSLVATGFPYDRRDRASEYAEVVGDVLAIVEGLRRMGTASLDLAWVAAGRYDRFWELKLAPWDVAAGLLIVREAGGAATDRRGRPSAPADDHFIVSNGVDHDEFRTLLDDALGDLVP